MSVIEVVTTIREDGLVHETADFEGLSADFPISSPYVRRKGVVDGVLAALLLVPGLPIIGLLVLVVQLTSRGPGLFCQERVGKDGRTFTMYKLRTMRRDAEAATGAVWAQENDPRVTLVGRVLRKLHLDELPQLFNVLNGDMSLIGPRPERPELVPELARDIPGYLNRLAVRPGITGLARINLEPDVDLNDVRRKLVLDLEYIRSASGFLDLRIFLCTVLHLVGTSGELAKRIVGLGREVMIEDHRTPLLFSPSAPGTVSAESGGTLGSGAIQSSHDCVVSE